MHDFTSSSDLSCSATALRTYLGQPALLPKISDPELQLEVLSAPDVIEVNSVIVFRISAYGFRQRMQHRYVQVSDLEIVAEQIEGPTRKWVHKQTISIIDDQSCTLTDHVTFVPPGGMLGFVLTAERIRESLEEGMAFRYSALEEILGNV